MDHARLLVSVGETDFDRLMGLLGIEAYEPLEQAYFKWIDRAMQPENIDELVDI